MSASRHAQNRAQGASDGTMATYRLSAQVIKRKEGRTVVAAASYRAAEKLHDERLGQTFDFRRKAGVEHTEILLPKDAPEWMGDREKLWNAVEKAEKRKDSQLAREVQVSLPRELNSDQQISLVRDFVREQMTERGMVADVSIHRDNPDNPHAHILITTREVVADGFGKKLRPASEWNKRKDELLTWRSEWSRHANLALERAGLEMRIDHRSYLDQGIALEPQSKIGRSRDEAARDGREIVQERMAEHEAIARRNGEAIIANPLVALDAITHQRATFTRSDVGRFLNTHTADAEQFQRALEAVMASSELVKLHSYKQGGQRYTTREMIRVELRLASSAQEMSANYDHRVAPRFVRQAEHGRTLSEEQRGALEHLAKSGNVAVIEGRAGSGKSYLFGAAREAWEAQGYQVKGAALAGKAAEGLQISSGIVSRSLASWEYAWKRGRDQLDKRDVLVVDEAGMVGTRQMQRVLEHVERAGAKVVLVGDTEQLQAIEAGAALRAVRDQVGSYELSEIRRQQVDWQREAAQELARGEPLPALRRFYEHGHVHGHATQDDAIRAVVEAWKEGRDQPWFEDVPGETRYPSQIMLAYRRDEVQKLNELAREYRKEIGELDSDHRIQTARGARDFAVGDRVYFLKNDRGLEVKNGTLGYIDEIRGHAMSVRLDDGRRVAFDTRDYNHLDHGYAGTVHKGQGITVDRAYVLASELYDRHATYVGLSRQRWHAELHWSREKFQDVRQMASQISRARPKDMALDYARVEHDAKHLDRDLHNGAMDRGRSGLRDPTLGRAPGQAGERDRAGLEREPRAHGQGPEDRGRDDAQGLDTARRGDRARERESTSFGHHREGGSGFDQGYGSEGLRASGEHDKREPKGKPCLHPEDGALGHSSGGRLEPSNERLRAMANTAEGATRPAYSSGRGVCDVRQHEAQRDDGERASDRIQTSASKREPGALGPSTQRLAELAERAEARARQRQALAERRQQIERDVAAGPPEAVQLRAPEVLEQWQQRLQTREWTEAVQEEVEHFGARFAKLEAAYEKAFRAYDAALKKKAWASERRPLEEAAKKAREELHAAYQDLSKRYQKAGQHVRGGTTTASRQWERLADVRELARGLMDAHRKLCDAHRLYADWEKTHPVEASWGLRPDRAVIAARQQYSEVLERAKKARCDSGLQQQACKHTEKHNREYHIAKIYQGALRPLHDHATKGIERIQQHQLDRERQRCDRQRDIGLGFGR